MSAPATDLPDRCPRCWCEGCGGTLAQHETTGCTCETCTTYSEPACGQFLPDGRVAIFAEQLGPLLSSHLHERYRLRCLAVAHAAHHALLDYDYPKETR